MFMPSGVTAAAGNEPVQIVGGSLVHSNPTNAGAYVEIKFLAAAPFEEQQAEAGIGLITVGNWLKFGNAADWFIRFDGAGDNPSGDAVNSLLQMNVDRRWFFNLSTPDSILDFIGDITITNGTTITVKVPVSLSAINGAPP